MAYKITEDCVSCGACEIQCPNKAINEGKTLFVIDPEKCTRVLAKWRNLHPGETPKT